MQCRSILYKLFEQLPKHMREFMTLSWVPLMNTRWSHRIISPSVSVCVCLKWHAILISCNTYILTCMYRFHRLYPKMQPFSFLMMDELDEHHLACYLIRPKIGLKIQNNNLFLNSITSWLKQCVCVHVAAEFIIVYCRCFYTYTYNKLMFSSLVPPVQFKSSAALSDKLTDWCTVWQT